MNVLIVHAHPEPRSFNAAMKDAAIEVFRVSGHAVRVSDLYAMKFEAAGGPHDFLALRDAGYFRYQREQEHAAATDGYVPQLTEEIEKVAWADLVLLQFPLWWSSLPAILKGWVDRVLAWGFAPEAARTRRAGAPGAKRAMLALTTGDPRSSFGPGSRNGEIDDLLLHIQHGMLHRAGMEVLPPFVAYGVTECADEDRHACLEAYRQRLAGIAKDASIEPDALERTGGPAPAQAG